MNPETKVRAVTIHTLGILLFLFIPLVLFLFLRFPFGILISFSAALLIMFAHRFMVIPFMRRYRSERCFWCGKTSRIREAITVSSGEQRLGFEFCRSECSSTARSFFDFCTRYKIPLRLGIFLPLGWYVITMLLSVLGWPFFPVEWNRFIFRFFIAGSVVSISLLYKRGHEVDDPSFPFPIHNLFLLGAKNTLLVFGYVGIWWILASLYFLYTRLH